MKKFITIILAGIMVLSLAACGGGGRADEAYVGENISSVTIDHKKAQYEVAKILLEETQAKKILYICGDEDCYVTRTRMDGMEELAEEIGVDLIVKFADFSESKAREIVLQYGEEADAVVCASDLMAIGAKTAMKKMQIERPICGFDGISLMEYAGQGIYTIGQNFSEISAIAMEELQRLMTGASGRMVEVEYSWIKN